MGLGSCSPGWMEPLRAEGCFRHALPLSIILSLVLIISRQWQPGWCLFLGTRSLFVMGRASPPPGLPVCPSPWHLGTFLGCSMEHPASPSAQPGVNDFPRTQRKQINSQLLLQGLHLLLLHPTDIPCGMEGVG